MSAFNDAKFPNTREASLGAARAFAPNMSERYTKERNRVVPGHPYVSMLAPAIRVRLALEREVAQIALDEHEKVYKCQKFVQEIHWRSYWRSWLEIHAAMRAGETWKAETTEFEAANSDELTAQIGDWARAAKVKTVVALKPFVGPTDDALDAVRARLQQNEIGLVLLRRPEDAAGLQYATKGFFKFWGGIKQEGTLD